MSDAEFYSGVFEFTELGRRKFSGLVSIQNKDDFTKLLDQHLMSADVEWSYLPDDNAGYVFVSGFRLVGKFRKVIK